MIQWHAETTEFVRSTDQRFDCIFVRNTGVWLAIDHDAPVAQFRCGSLIEAKAWCEQRLKGRTR